MLWLQVGAITLGFASIISFIFLMRFFVGHQRDMLSFNRRKMICLMIQHVCFSAMTPFCFLIETPEEGIKWVRNGTGLIALFALATELLNSIVDRRNTWRKVVRETRMDPMDRLYLSMWLEHYGEVFVYFSIISVSLLILGLIVHGRRAHIEARRTSFIEENIKTHTFDPANAAENKNCPICLNDYEAGQEIAETNCHHIFHDQCLRDWLKDQSTCPMCREQFF